MELKFNIVGGYYTYSFNHLDINTDTDKNYLLTVDKNLPLDEVEDLFQISIKAILIGHPENIPINVTITEIPQETKHDNKEEAKYSYWRNITKYFKVSPTKWFPLLYRWWSSARRTIKYRTQRR